MLSFCTKRTFQIEKKEGKEQELYALCMCCSECAQGQGSAHFGEGTGEIVLDNVQCTGNESRLIDCAAITTHNCGHHEDASVTCTRKYIYY